MGKRIIIGAFAGIAVGILAVALWRFDKPPSEADWLPVGVGIGAVLGAALGAWLGARSIPRFCLYFVIAFGLTGFVSVRRTLDVHSERWPLAFLYFDFPGLEMAVEVLLPHVMICVGLAAAAYAIDRRIQYWANKE